MYRLEKSLPKKGQAGNDREIPGRAGDDDARPGMTAHRSG